MITSVVSLQGIVRHSGGWCT